jgi:hypothetical protein
VLAYFEDEAWRRMLSAKDAKLDHIEGIAALTSNTKAAHGLPVVSIPNGLVGP